VHSKNLTRKVVETIMCTETIIILMRFTANVIVMLEMSKNGDDSIFAYRSAIVMQVGQL